MIAFDGTTTAAVPSPDGDIQSEADALQWQAFEQVRESFVDLSGGTVATLIFCEKALHIATRQRLSRANFRVICEKLTKLGAAFAGSLSQLDGYGIIINGIPSEDYRFTRNQSKIANEVTFPLYLQKRPLGVLFVDTLEAEHNAQLTHLVKTFKADFASGVHTLWRYYRRQKEKLQALVSATLDGVLFCSMSGRIQFINHTALRLLKANTRRNWTGEPLDALKADFLIGYLREAVEHGLSELNRVAELQKKRTRLIGTHLELLKDTRYQEMGWMIVLRDITRNWRDDSLRSTLAITNHEVKTPLSSINGVVELLLNQEIGGLNEKQTRCLEIVRDDIGRLQRMLSKTLDPMRPENEVKFEDRRKQTSLAMLVDKVITLLQPFAQIKKLQLENRLSGALPTVSGDRDRLQQIIFNLVENSIKYSLPGGRVEVKAELRGSEMCVAVTDDGVGIPSSQLGNVFKRFVQLDNSPEHSSRGHGLGLSIAKDLVNQAGGEIWAESEVGAGSTFYFTIPV